MVFSHCIIALSRYQYCMQTLACFGKPGCFRHWLEKDMHSLVLVLHSLVLVMHSPVLVMHSPVLAMHSLGPVLIMHSVCLSCTPCACFAFPCAC